MAAVKKNKMQKGWWVPFVAMLLANLLMAYYVFAAPCPCFEIKLAVAWIIMVSAPPVSLFYGYIARYCELEKEGDVDE